MPLLHQTSEKTSGIRKFQIVFGWGLHRAGKEADWNGLLNLSRQHFKWALETLVPYRELIYRNVSIWPLQRLKLKAAVIDNATNFYPDRSANSMCELYLLV